MKNSHLAWMGLVVLGVMCGCAKNEVLEPKDAEKLYESGDVALFVAVTEADVAHYAEEQSKYGYDAESCNSLFMRTRVKENSYKWQRLLSSNDGTKIADMESKWCVDASKRALDNLYVVGAIITKDRSSIWMTCRSTPLYTVVCKLDLINKTFSVMTDGCSPEEQEDGTIRIYDKKTYLQDERGEPLGAHWYDLWMTREGEVVRKTKPRILQDMKDLSMDKLLLDIFPRQYYQRGRRNYISDDGNFVVIGPWGTRRVNGEQLHPLAVLTRKDDGEFGEAEIFLCKMIDLGSCGNRCHQTLDGNLAFEDYSYTHSTDRGEEPIYLIRKDYDGELRIHMNVVHEEDL